MRFKLSHRTTRTLIVGVMLFAVAMRALIPQGFMPASDRPFSIQICPEGFPIQLLVDSGHHHHPGTHSHSDHCVFGSACANGPVPHLPTLIGVSLASLAPAVPSVSVAIVIQLVHLPYARGPPAAT
jgi:hypothetical protein